MTYIKKRNKISRGKFIAKEISKLKDFWPITERQLMYILYKSSPKFGIKKYQYTQLNYELFQDRKHRLFPPHAFLEDDSQVPEILYPDVPAYIENVGEIIRSNYRQDLMIGQSVVPMIITGRKNLIPQIRKVADKYSVVVVPPSCWRFRNWIPDFMKYYRKGRRIKFLFICGKTPQGFEEYNKFIKHHSEYFWLNSTKIICLTKAQIKKYKLPESQLYELNSRRAKKYVDKYGKVAYDLEALHPSDMANIIEKAILRNIDVNKFNDMQITEEKSKLYLWKLLEHIDKFAE